MIERETLPRYADGKVTDIAALSSQARRLLPQLTISDAIFTERSAARLRAWRSQECEPSARRFKGDAALVPELPVTPRRRPLRQPARLTLLELTVYPDALETTPRLHKPGILVRAPLDLVPSRPCRRCSCLREHAARCSSLGDQP